MWIIDWVCFDIKTGFILSIQNSKLLIQNSDVLSSDTIFAFLMLNTPRPAHNKIFGAKFVSFERLEIICLYIEGCAVF